MSIYGLQAFKSFCNLKDWKIYEVFNTQYLSGFIGRLANSDPIYSGDWIEIIKDKFDVDSFIWNEAKSTCTFPGTIKLTILYSKASSPEDPQNYIVAAALETISTIATYTPLTQLSNFMLRVQIIYEPESPNKLYQYKRVRPSIFPSLPLDIASPFSN